MEVLLAALLLVTAVVTAAYWVDFFGRGSVQAGAEDWYLRFERAFPVADAWMATASLVAAIGLLGHRDYGVVFGLVAAGALLFLGLMDLTFNVQNGLFRLLPQSAEMWAEVVIIGWCLGLGGVLLGHLAGHVG